MSVALQLTEQEEAKALPILLRHTPGMLLPARTYSISREAMMELQQAGVQFIVLSRDGSVPRLDRDIKTL